MIQVTWKKHIKKNIQKTFRDLQAAQKALAVSENNVKSAKENLNIEQENIVWVQENF